MIDPILHFRCSELALGFNSWIRGFDKDPAAGPDTPGAAGLYHL